MLTLKEAIPIHTAWKIKLKQQIEAGVELDAMEVGNPHLCELGQWIYGEGLTYTNLPSYEILCYHHDHLHRAAADMVRWRNQGDVAMALRMMQEDGALMKSSNKLVWAISELSKELEQRATRAAAASGRGDIQRILDRKQGYRLHSIESRATLADAMRFMEMHHTGYLAVFEARRFLGIFSERWLVRNLPRHGPIALEVAQVAQYLDTETVSLDGNASIEDCLGLMMKTRKWHLPVVENDRLVGILSLGDIIQHVLSQDGDCLCFGGHGPALLTMLQTL